MTRLLFICHGNICRSPMAEFIFRDIAKAAGKSDEFTVSSCATSAEEIYNGVGAPVYTPTREELARHGISCGAKRAVQLTRDDYGKYDLLVCMDSANRRNALRILGGDPEGKVRMLLSDRDVSDPWYTDRFDVAYSDILLGCTQLFRSLTEESER